MTAPQLNLAVRLFAAQALVVFAGAVTLAVVAAVVGPAIFHEHLRQANGHVSAEAARHVEEAYVSASALSFGVALAAALVAALAINAFVARRIARPVRQLAAAAADVAEGHYAVRLAPPGLGTEFDTVAASFNAMATRLQDVEATRRRLLADLGHEMRTPLATIEAYLEAVEDGVAVDDEDVLSVLHTQTNRLRRLSDDIAAVSRAEEQQLDLHPVRVDPATLVRVAVAGAAPRYAAKGVTLDQQVDAEVPDVYADPERMGQVLGNVLDNALQHTPTGGRVSIRATRAATGTQITVTDTGEGIPAEHLPHIFERFYRADAARDRRHGGSGIGLAIVHAIVTAHHGHVTAHSAGPGTGTTFTLTLPPAQGTTPQQ